MGTDPLTPPPNRVGRDEPSLVCITNVTLHPEPGQVVDKAMVVIRDGKIVQAGPAGGPPAGARVIDGAGQHVYAGFIEPYLEVDTPRPDADAKGAHWNMKVMPQRRAIDGKPLGEDVAKGLRAMGFTSAVIAPRGGVFRGQGAWVSLAKADDDASISRPEAYAPSVYQSVFMELGREDAPDAARWPGYPNSQMGAIALIRQCLSDADWLKANAPKGPEVPVSLTALNLPMPMLMNADDDLEVLRMAKIAREFNRGAIILGSGNEYKRLDPIAALKLPMIVPINFPEAPRVATLGEQESVELRELMSWEQAPTNPRRLKAAGVNAMLSTAKLKDRSKFRDNLRTAIRHGLSDADALAMLTTIPAQTLGLGDQLGTIAIGKRANLVICDGPIFAKKTKIREVYIDGQRHEVTPPPSPLVGRYDLVATPRIEGAGRMQLVIDADGGIKLIETPMGGEIKPRTMPGKNVQLQETRMSAAFDLEPTGQQGVLVLSGAWDGQALMLVAALPDGARTTVVGTKRATPLAVGNWRATQADEALKDEKDPKQLFMRITDETLTLIFVKEDGTLTKINAEEVKIAPRGELNKGSFVHALEPIGGKGKSNDMFTIEGDTLSGESTLPDGSKHTYKAVRLAPGTPMPDDDESPKPVVSEELPGYPFGPYAIKKMPEAAWVIFTNATIWTSGPEGKIERGEIEIKDGKVVRVTKPLPDGQIADVNLAGDGFDKDAPKPLVVDCKGKHITPGLIDCHSHTGISRGVNESGQAVTAEVRIGDVTDPTAVNWYRQLTGGITTVNSLHGSANPIGGQNQVNKNRWGVSEPDAMHFEGAIPGIKFALGENVKQSNWGAANTWRYPQTRMGVETIIRDRFLAAREYLASRGTPGFRRDLELEALGEILEGKRLVHCHSYRQDEILMLARIAQEFGFKIGTYQHILEGYKVAEFVRDFSGGGSAFADWWGYKVEVQDAIPQAGPIMHEQGVTVSYNSDSDEMARRMNVEASKARKYARLPDGSYTLTPEEALKFVTLNPAKQLRIDSRVGSLEAGKDADLVIWSGPPMSSLSRCEQTWVDGKLAFSLERDAELRKVNASERQRLIAKLLSDPNKKPKAKEAPKPAETPAPEAKPETKPDATKPPSLIARMLDEGRIRRREMYMELLRRGIDPTGSRAGVCGCEE
jgi:N-acetylglucosamine-6-phosphate deacetylase